MIIYLIGARCSGKTSSGKILSSMLGYKFIDTDLYIQKEQGRSISQIIDKQGWKFFREIESDCLNKISKMKNIVVSTGGGIIENPLNRKLMKNTGVSIWLKADAHIILERMKSDDKSALMRPSLTELEEYEEINKILIERNPVYKKMALFSVDTGSVSISHVSDKIYGFLKKGE
ncbi:MAG: shikimate kinase II [Deltaproteobacteria bacterium]|nr:MAG: shikimate kinase II [Deltaproteobacteria bacterium]